MIPTPTCSTVSLPFLINNPEAKCSSVIVERGLKLTDLVQSDGLWPESIVLTDYACEMVQGAVNDVAAFLHTSDAHQ